MLQKRFKKKIKQRQNGIALLERRWMCPTRINKWPDPLKSRKVAPLAFFGVKKKQVIFPQSIFWENCLLFLGMRGGIAAGECVGKNEGKRTKKTEHKSMRKSLFHSMMAENHFSHEKPASFYIISYLLQV